MLLVGNPAPLFTAPAVLDGENIVPQFSLESLLGKQNILLFFYPKDFTFVCPTELLALQARIEDFHKRNVAVIGCSTDTEETHYAWLQTPINRGGIKGVKYPLVADTSKTIATNFGVLGGDWKYDEQGRLAFEGIPVAYRATFFIDKEGIVRYQNVQDLSLGRNIKEIIRIIDMWEYSLAHGKVCPANWQAGAVAMEPTPQGVATYMSQHLAPVTT